MKILHLPNNIAGFSSGLAEGQKILGHDVASLTLNKSRFSYPADRCLAVEEKSRLGRLFAYASAFAEVRTGYDFYNFGFGSSLWHFPERGLPLLDLPFYSRSAKKIITYQGCDARQKFATMELREKESKNPIGACFDENCYGGVCNSGRRDIERRRAIEKAAKHVDHIFAVNPDLMHFLPSGKSSFLPYAITSFNDLPNHEGAFCSNDTVHIVHAPTQREAKGSAYILSALEELQEEEGRSMRVTVIENMERDKALSLIATADLLIDQVTVGWYGGITVEAMKMGVPVACYINEPDLDFVPKEMASHIPVFRLTPFDVKERLRHFLANREMTAELARQGRDYVMRWHESSVVAKQVFKSTFGTETP